MQTNKKNFHVHILNAQQRTNCIEMQNISNKNSKYKKKELKTQ